MRDIYIAADQGGCTATCQKCGDYHNDDIHPNAVLEWARKHVCTCKQRTDETSCS